MCALPILFIFSKVLGRHLPASPNAMRGAMDDLGQKLPADLPGPIVFLGMAETATALGQGVFEAYLDAQERQNVVGLHSSRQIVDGAELIAPFEDGHRDRKSVVEEKRVAERIDRGGGRNVQK